MPSAKKQQNRQETHRHDVRVLRQKEQYELDPTVLGMKTTDELLLALGQVKRQAIGFCQCTGEEY